MFTSNLQNNWLYTAAATKKNASQQNPFAHHQCSVPVSDGVSSQLKIGLVSRQMLTDFKIVFIIRVDSEFAVNCHWKCHKNPKYLATVHCDFSLITISVSSCHLFSDINMSHGSVATHLRCGGIFSYYFTANLLLNQQWKNFENLLRFNGVTMISLVVYFFGTQCTTVTLTINQFF